MTRSTSRILAAAASAAPLLLLTFAVAGCANNTGETTTGGAGTSAQPAAGSGAISQGTQNVKEGAEQMAQGAKEQMSGAGRMMSSAAQKAAAPILTPKVKNALAANTQIDASTINVDTLADKKTVVLRGAVPSAAKKALAAQIATKTLKEAGSDYTVTNQLTVNAAK